MKAIATPRPKDPRKAALGAPRAPRKARLGGEEADAVPTLSRVEVTTGGSNENNYEVAAATRNTTYEMDNLFYYVFLCGTWYAYSIISLLLFLLFRYYI